MKTKITLLLFVCISFNINAQIKTKVLTLDLSKPQSETLTSSDTTDNRLVFWSKEPLQFQLINGNPFRYKYVINNKMVNFFEDQSNNPLSNIEKVLNSASPKKAENESDVQNPAIANTQSLIHLLEVEKSEDSINRNTKNLKLNTIKLNQLKLELKDIIQNSYKAKSTSSYLFLTKFGNDVVYPQNIEEDQNIVLDALSLMKSKIEGLYNSIVNDEMAFRSDDDFDFVTFKEKRTNYNNNYQEFLQEYLSIKSDVKKFTKPTEAMQNAETALDTTITKINEKIVLFFNIRRDNYIMPIDVNGKNIDVVEITVKRFEHNNLIPEEFNYNIWAKGGFKIDISGGVYITSLVDKEYTTVDKTETVNNVPVSGKIIFEKEKGNYDFGFGSSINISHRSAGWINPTLNVGALFTANQKFQLLTGLGLILGKQERIIFSGGLSMGRIDTIAQNIKADGTTIYDIGVGGQVPVESIFSFGGYFGITYNFSKTKKQTPTN
nr:hypothetical protein [uncultured Flavobacterium sp.]